MTRTIKLLATASCVAISALGATGAQAAGTTSGSIISNTATVNYSVGGVAQPAVSNTPTTFTVDRKVVFRVDETAPSATTTVAPGQSAAVTTFTVSNTSNATMDFGLSVAQLAGGTAPHGGTDNFDVTAPGIFADTNGNGVYDAGTDLAITYLDEVLADTSRTVFVVANIPAGRTTGDVAAVSLTGQARDGGVSGTQGAVSTNTAGANTAGVDTVLADTAYDALNTASDGLGVARDDYTVSTATLTLTKVVRIIEDPINTIASGNAANAKMIPGATIEYCIIVSNSGAATATPTSITDPVPSTLTIDATSLRVNGTATAGVCNANGVAGGGVSGQNVTSSPTTLNSVPTGGTVTMYFRATIN